MRRFYSHLPYYLVILFFYWPLYELFLPPYTQGTLYKQSSLLYTSGNLDYIVTL